MTVSLCHVMNFGRNHKVTVRAKELDSITSTYDSPVLIPAVFYIYFHL